MKMLRTKRLILPLIFTASTLFTSILLAADKPDTSRYFYDSATQQIIDNQNWKSMRFNCHGGQPVAFWSTDHNAYFDSTKPIPATFIDKNMLKRAFLVLSKPEGEMQGGILLVNDTLQASPSMTLSITPKSKRTGIYQSYVFTTLGLSAVNATLTPKSGDHTYATNFLTIFSSSSNMATVLNEPSIQTLPWFDRDIVYVLPAEISESKQPFYSRIYFSYYNSSTIKTGNIYLPMQADDAGVANGIWLCAGASNSKPSVENATIQDQVEVR